jgi:hypothetical protein
MTTGSPGEPQAPSGVTCVGRNKTRSGAHCAEGGVVRFAYCALRLTRGVG